MKKNICFIVNNADYFISHRINIANELLKNGDTVELYAPFPSVKSYNYLLEKNIKVFSLPFSREKIAFSGIIKTFLMSFQLGIKNNSIFHLVTIIPIILCGIPLRILNKCCIFSVSGLGTVFISKKYKYKLLKYLVMIIYRFLFNGKKSKLIIQNMDDYFFFKDVIKIKENNIELIKGSGVDPNNYPYYSELPKSECPIILFPARLIKEKGIHEIINASRILNKKNFLHEIWIAGDVDPGNPSSLKSLEIEALKKDNPSLKFLGFRNDIALLLSKCTIVCLPSYREGLPKALIEAAACGRAIITTDVPGCREIVSHEKTGILVKVASALDLSIAIENLLIDQNKMEVLRRQAYNDYLNEFTSNAIVNKIISIYTKLLNI
ncbi:glycosyltransferase [Silvanigrella paludirubra]|uniref:Glycosyltransferase n=1 Tax=Silvanigrella paludirubra TaxID=2499159 RepID=A0A6N6VPG3_9BACT|nr:glycosyltransferase family 4 protein [Silvanigrella paludirubra]KAB8036836.1 glycosyltransferase [Silvanigrella paludirubra]